jgi:hypothetical protein
MNAMVGRCFSILLLLTHPHGMTPLLQNIQPVRGSRAWQTHGSLPSEVCMSSTTVLAVATSSPHLLAPQFIFCPSPCPPPANMHMQYTLNTRSLSLFNYHSLTEECTLQPSHLPHRVSRRTSPQITSSDVFTAKPALHIHSCSRHEHVTVERT